jgi:hypothetical protein
MAIIIDEWKECERKQPWLFQGTVPASAWTYEQIWYIPSYTSPLTSQQESSVSFFFSSQSIYKVRQRKLTIFKMHYVGNP